MSWSLLDPSAFIASNCPGKQFLVPRFYDLREVKFGHFNTDNIHDTPPVWVSVLLPACVLCNDTTLLRVIGTKNKPCPPGTALVSQCVITANWGKGAELNV